MYKIFSSICCIVINVKLKNLHGQNDMGYVILESEDSNRERKIKLCWFGLPNPLHGRSQMITD